MRVSITKQMTEALGPLSQHDAGLGNTVARSGLVRCDCGCKYWESDACIDCGYTLQVRHLVVDEWGGLAVER